MLDTKLLYLLYNFLPEIRLDSVSNANTARGQNHCYILFAFLDTGPIEETSLKKSYERFISSQKHQVNNSFEYQIETKSYSPSSNTCPYKHRDHTNIGPFSSMIEMNKFIVELLKKFELSKSSILSVTEFNSLLESSHQIGSPIELFKSHGKEIFNTEFNNNNDSNTYYPFGAIRKIFKI